MLLRAVLVILAVLAAGCGGSTTRDGDGSGGVPGSGGGESGGAGGTGGAGAGGTSAGGTGGSASGNPSSVVTSTTSGMCDGVGCQIPVCPDGRLVTPPGECCPVCTCDDVLCEPLDCPFGSIIDQPGHCCAECVALACEGVECEQPIECASGRTYSRPEGACCAGCMPDGPASCNDIECAPDVACAPGYVRGDLMGGCCYECLPDPLYCESAHDCVRADRPSSCCGCPEVISTRALDDNPCWRPVEASHPLPDECYPDPSCDIICDECPELGAPDCIDNRCMDGIPLL